MIGRHRDHAAATGSSSVAAVAEAPERTAFDAWARRPRRQGDGRRARYLPALDGLRALAILAVLAFHGGMPWATGGFLGVDAFFVLSGYLITSLLLAEWRAGRPHRPAQVLEATGPSTVAGAAR